MTAFLPSVALRYGGTMDLPDEGPAITTEGGASAGWHPPP